ncbi:MAG: phage tail tube protein [Melioribacteraceae bacterium]
MEKIRSALFAKIETVYGTDPTPVAATDAIEAYDQPSFELVTDPKARTVPISTFGELAPLILGKSYKLGGIKVPLKGSGAAGTVPRIAPLLRALGFTQTITATVSVAYTVHSTLEGESCTLYFWFGGTRHILTGCVGSGKLSLQAAEVMFLECDFTGIYGGTISDVTFPSPTFESTVQQIWDSALFKFTPAAGSDLGLIVTKFDIDLGNEVNSRPDANGISGIGRYYISDRKTKVSLDPEKVALATFNPYTLHENQTLIAIETKPTGTAGNLVEILVGGVSLDAPKAGNRNNVAAWELGGQCRATVAAGNNEISITFK